MKVLNLLIVLDLTEGKPWKNTEKSFQNFKYQPGLKSIKCKKQLLQ